MSDSSGALDLLSAPMTLRVCPVVAVADRRMLGIDLLPTWPDMAAPAVDPDDIWAYAEAQGILREATLRVISGACSRWIGWFGQGVAPRMSLAVRYAALNFDDAPEQILAALRQTGVPPSKLQLRIAEAELVTHTSSCLAIARKLRASGLTVAIDNCGDCYAELGSIQTNPFESIRIKPAYVATLDVDPVSRLTVASLSKLGSERGLIVVGPGVCTTQQWDFLRESNCDGMQGRMIAEPMPADDLIDWMYMNRWQRIHRATEEEESALASSAPSAAEPPALRHDEPSRCALIVDDDPLVSKVLARQLANLGFPECITASDGEQAMFALHSDQVFDIIFCDLKMPGTDGIEFLRNAASLIPDVAVVLISSVDAKILRSAASLARAHQLSLLGTLNKPINVQELGAILERLNRHASNRELHSNVSVDLDEFRAALRGGQVEPFFQPQVDVNTGALVGAEALARWRRDGGLVAPEAFMPLATANALLDELTDVILAGSIKALQLWEQADLVLNVSINVSLETLERLDFPEHMSALCAAAGIARSRLQVEVTETTAMHDPVRTLDVATRLRMQGFDLSIDDFGTGYSTQSQLREMPFNELKVDQNFVGMAHQDHEARSIVETNLNLARSLSLRSVAEGVETAEDWRLLRALGCDVLQGYFVSHARSAGEFLDWAQNEHAEKLRLEEYPP